jgi:KDO2-lipid IV(A) lauroyltransferase
MKILKYFFEFIFIGFLFLFFSLLGLKFSSKLGEIIVGTFGPFFRSKKIIDSNILKALPNIDFKRLDTIRNSMWKNYGKILSEYMFLKDFRNSKYESNIKIEGEKILETIKINNKPVIFISGHFNNFELMAMQIEKSGVKLAAIYRPLNNIFLNGIMEKIRKKYICKNQIKKGKSGTRELLTLFKDGHSIALMIDQRVTQGIKSNFFGKEAYTTTIPAQFIKKFDCKIVPVYIQRFNSSKFEIKFYNPLSFDKKESIEKITNDLNLIIEKMILNNPEQWIWTHNRWK